MRYFCRRWLIGPILICLATLALAGDEADIWQFPDKGLQRVKRHYDIAIDRAQTELVSDLEKRVALLTRRDDLEGAMKVQEALELAREIAPPSLNRKMRIPDEAVRWGGHRYILFEDLKTWHQAQQHCEELGGYLVCVTSRQEDELVRRLSRDQHVWLGGSDEMEEGEWMWVTGERSSYTNWRQGRPDNHKLAQHHLLSMNGRVWEDDYAGSRRQYICEWGN